jgi:hypothetical protein
MPTGPTWFGYQESYSVGSNEVSLELKVRPLLPFLLFGLGLAPAAAFSCEAAVHYSYNTPVEIEGTLRSGTGHHEVQGNFSYTYVALDHPVCVDAASGDEFNETTEKPIERIQLAGEASQQDPPEDGARIAVKGKLFGAHTAWHVEPVLIDAESIDQKSTN